MTLVSFLFDRHLGTALHPTRGRSPLTAQVLMSPGHISNTGTKYLKPSFQDICILDLESFLVGYHLQSLCVPLGELCLVSPLPRVDATPKHRWHWYWPLLCAHFSLPVHASITRAPSPSPAARHTCFWTLLPFFLLGTWHCHQGASQSSEAPSVGICPRNRFARPSAELCSDSMKWDPL